MADSKGDVLIPAVLEMRTTGTVFTAPVAVCLVAAVVGLVDRVEVAVGFVIAAPIFLGLMWAWTGRRFVREVAEEARGVPESARIVERRPALRRVAIRQVPTALLLGGLLVLAPGSAGIAFGASLYWWLLAARLQAHERASGHKFGMHGLPVAWHRWPAVGAGLV